MKFTKLFFYIASFHSIHNTSVSDVSIEKFQDGIFDGKISTPTHLKNMRGDGGHHLHQPLNPPTEQGGPLFLGEPQSHQTVQDGRLTGHQPVGQEAQVHAHKGLAQQQAQLGGVLVLFSGHEADEGSHTWKCK